MTDQLTQEQVEGRLGRTLRVRAEDMAPGDGREWDPGSGGRGDGPTPTPTPTLVERRTGRLSRPRRTVAIAAGILAVTGLAVGGLVARAQQAGGPSTELTPAEEAAGFEIGEPWEPPPAGDGTFPVFTVDGFRVTDVYDHSGPGGEPAPGVPEVVNQVFRRPGNFTGPTARVRYREPCDLDVHFNMSRCTTEWELEPDVPNREPDDVIDLGSGEAQLWARGPAVRILYWDLEDGATVRVETLNLTTVEAIAFADGLEPKPDELGMQATVLPQDIEEGAPDAVVYYQAPQRVISVEGEGISITVRMERGDERTLSGYLHSESMVSIEQVDVLGQPAALVRNAGNEAPPAWVLVWRHTDDTVVSVLLPEMDRGQVDRIKAGIRELDEAEVRSLL